jgi:AcrR family transcriptional regulator
MKSEILETALKQFLRYGIREMSIQKLVAPLGISTKTVYKYFENKEELLEEALLLYYAQQYQVLESLPADQNVVHVFFDIWYTGVDLEYKVNKVFFQDLNYYYPELEMRVERMISKKFWKKFIQLIQRGIEEGVFKEDILPEVVLEGISVLYIAIVRKEQFKSFHITAFNILLNTIAIYIRGFCTQKGIQELDECIQVFETSRTGKKFGERMPVYHS